MSGTSLAPDLSLEKMLKEIQSLEALISSWDDANKVNAVMALRRAIDQLHKEAFSRLIKTFRQDKEAMALFKEAASDELIYAVLRHHELIKPSMHERIEKALDTVRPMLQGHGGNVELVAVEAPSTVVIRLLGTCNGCPAADLTFTEGIEKAIKEFCPEITEIKKSKINTISKCDDAATVQFISPFAKASDAGWSRLADLAEVPECQLRAFDVEGKSILLYRMQDKLYCYYNACAHMGLPIDTGELEDNKITCPYHGFRYALDSGECLTVPEVQLQACPVRVVGNTVEVKVKGS